MKVMAQMAMVMNLDKCIGCHTCSVTCKQAWTNRAGGYVWFNNVETRPGLGYPRGYEDQGTSGRAAGRLTGSGNLTLKSGNRWKKAGQHLLQPQAAVDRRLLRAVDLRLRDAAERPGPEALPGRAPDLAHLRQADERQVVGQLGRQPRRQPRERQPRRHAQEHHRQGEARSEQTFMFYLPRICEHCLNPSCAASCPSGAIYKRSEDGIVLVDQDKCRGWHVCLGLPYKKVYFNHKTGKAEKCTFCYPRIEVGIPTVCSETCVGRLRYIGLVLYDADRVSGPPRWRTTTSLYEAQRSVFLDPNDPAVQREAERAGIPGDWIEAAKRSPVFALINRYQVALPLHPEYRTLPMVWYIPPLYSVVDVIKDTGHDAEDPGNLFAAIDLLRIPVEYLANLFTAGDTKPVDAVLKKNAAMRISYMRDINLGRDPDESIPESVGMDGETLYDMFRLLAIAKYDERYVIPTAHAEQAHALENPAAVLARLRGGPRHDGRVRPVRRGSGEAHPRGGRELPDAQAAPDLRRGDRQRQQKGRVSLLNWDGKGSPGPLPQAQQGR